MLLAAPAGACCCCSCCCLLLLRLLLALWVSHKLWEALAYGVYASLVAVARWRGAGNVGPLGHLPAARGDMETGPRLGRLREGSHRKGPACTA